jgi:2-dehydropantoate 2-reductase
VRALVVGAGSVGGYFGGLLAAAGRDVTFLVRPRRAAQLADGLTIVSKGQESTIPVKFTTTGQAADEFDVILLAVKAYQLDAAVEDFGAYVSERTMILPVLNGMKHVDVLRSHFGSSHVIGGVAKIVTSLDERGRILDSADFHDLAYGERRLSDEAIPSMTLQREGSEAFPVWSHLFPGRTAKAPRRHVLR